MSRTLILSLLLAASCVAVGRAAQGEVWIIRNARVVPVSRPPVERASVLIENGIIREVGEQVAAPAGAREVDAAGLTVYPGLIDLHTSLAQLDGAAPGTLQPMTTAQDHLKALPAGVSPAWQVAAALRGGTRDLEPARNSGVTLALSAPRQGALPGTGALIHTAGEKPADLPVSGVGPVYFQYAGGRGGYPATTMGIVAVHRQALLDAGRYAVLRALEPQSAADANLDSLQPLLRREQPAFVVASRERDIQRALRLADEFSLRVVLAGGGDAGRFAPELKQKGAAVLFALGALSAAPAAGRPDPAGTPPALLRAGVPVALTSQGLQGYAGLRPAVRKLIAAGVSEEQALRALTLTPAEILGVTDRFGAVEPGRAANLVLADGPLFAEKTRIRRVFVRGASFEPPAPESAAATAKAEETKPQPQAPAPAAQPDVTLIRNGTLLTVTRGVIRNGSILIRDGKIAAIGPAASVTAPDGARVIDATGKWVMPGIIDAHSHMAIEGGINEGTYAITPEVRVLDVLNGKDVTIYRALAGGVTMAHVMHGSANAIGGQNAIIKLKWGRPVAEMVPADAPRTVKFALGENPKRSNFTAAPAAPPAPPGAPGVPMGAPVPPPAAPTIPPRQGGFRGGAAPSRYPTTRMGVEHLLRECFTAARAYKGEWDAYDRAVQQGERRTPPRRDLRLDALSDIMTGRILVEAHSYRADEILMLLRLAEEFGFKIRTLHHALEAYKVAPEIAKHGAGVSTFSDWWAYKMEAYDAIPHNAALCAKAGIRVSVNSDSNEQVRRLYWEAAKTMKYGGMSEADALKTITLWPAWQIGMEHRTGSLEVGKDADIALFSAHPFSAAALCELTLVEGQLYFNRRDDIARRGKPGYPAPDAEGALNIGSHDDGCGCDEL